MKRILTITILLAGGLLFANSFSTVEAQKFKDPNERGRMLYVQYCASCHGVDASGNGPVAPSLKMAVPDLRRIPKENGQFPALRVQNMIAGEVEVGAHGTREMPVWGRYFRHTKGQSRATMDVYALMRYVEAFQVKENAVKQS